MQAAWRRCRCSLLVRQWRAAALKPDRRLIEVRWMAKQELVPTTTSAKMIVASGVDDLLVH
jgi:hypothetical protein